MSLHESTYNDVDLGSDEFKSVLEDHLSVLKDSVQTRIPIDPVDAGRFEYDFYGLLRNQSIDPRYHWIVMRVNGLSNPNQYTRKITQIAIPDFDSIETIFSYYITVNKKNTA